MIVFGPPLDCSPGPIPVNVPHWVVATARAVLHVLADQLGELLPLGARLLVLAIGREGGARGLDGQLGCDARIDVVDAVKAMLGRENDEDVGVRQPTMLELDDVEMRPVRPKMHLYKYVYKGGDRCMAWPRGLVDAGIARRPRTRRYQRSVTPRLNASWMPFASHAASGAAPPAPFGCSFISSSLIPMRCLGVGSARVDALISR